MFTRSQYRAAVLAIAAALVLNSCDSRGTPKTGQQSKLFDRAASALDEAAKPNVSGVPEAVLNRTRCIVVLPANGDQGATSCFEALNRWTRPGVVTFRGDHPSKGDLFILILGEDEARKLRAGRLSIGSESSTAAGPRLHEKAVLTDADLNFGSLAYERRGAVLEGAKASGTITTVGAVLASGNPSQEAQHLERSLISFFNVITPAGIIIHHTAVLPGSQQAPTDREEVDNYHSQKGFDVVCFGREYHVAYHYLILPDGAIQAGRPERCQGAHAKGYNSYLGISVAGDFSSKDNPKGQKGPMQPSAAQVQTLVKLCRQLKQTYGIPMQRIMRHSDVAPTRCPGDRFPFLRVMQQIGP